MWWLLALAACSPSDPTPTAPAGPACGVAGTPDWQAPTPLPRDDELTLQDLQARGTHNSYHVAPDVPLDPSHAYTQAPLATQLEDQGVRQLELDVHLRTDGVTLDVYHLPGIDPRSTCPTFSECLQEICVWSASHPDHAPVLIWLEPKDDLDAISDDHQVLAGHTSAVEAAILGVFPRERVYTPDDWKRGEADLGSATAALGPPTLGEVRGKVLFGWLDSGDNRADYLSEGEDLAGRLLFPDTDTAADSFAALVKDADPPAVGALLAAGLVVTSNVDAADASDADNTATRDAALAAGVNFAASDVPAALDGRDYWMDLPGGEPLRCNPVTAASGCAASDLE